MLYTSYVCLRVYDCYMHAHVRVPGRACAHMCVGFCVFPLWVLEILTCVSLFVQDTIRFWLDQGVDGIRADAVAHIMVYSDYYRDQLLSNAPGAQPVCCQTCCSKVDRPTSLSN